MRRLGNIILQQLHPTLYSYSMEAQGKCVD